MLRVLSIVIALNLAACSDNAGLTAGCPANVCGTEETAPTPRLQGLENRFVLWLFTVLTFPFMAKG